MNPENQISTHRDATTTAPKSKQPIIYSAPRLLELGKAETMVRNSGPGPVKDYSNGWYTPRY